MEKKTCIEIKNDMKKYTGKKGRRETRLRNNTEWKWESVQKRSDMKKYIRNEGHKETHL